MAIIKQYKKKRNFVMYDCQIISDNRLSLKAKGLHAILMSYPGNWKPIVSQLSSLSKDGKTAHYSAMKELIECGYAEKITIRDNKNRITGIEYRIFETCDREDLEQTAVGEMDDFSSKDEQVLDLEPFSGFPETENLFPENLNPENLKVYNNKDININKSNILDNINNKHDLRLNIVKPSKTDNLNSDIDKIFTHWKTVLNHPQAKLGDHRKKLIFKALKLGYSVQELCHAIDGCSKSDYHMGCNEHAKIYDGLDLIFRNENKIDAFIKINETWLLSRDDHIMNQLGKQLTAKTKTQDVNNEQRDAAHLSDFGFGKKNVCNVRVDLHQ